MEKDFKNYKFFKKPCSICNKLQYDSDGNEYSLWNWAYCDEINERTMDILNLHKVFPNMESPKKCTRKKIFEFNINFDYQHECDYFSIVNDCEDTLDINWLVDDYEIPKRKLARRIASGLSDFNFRMRTFGRVAK